MKKTAALTIDEKIEKARETVLRLKERYDKAADELQQLLEKKEAMRKEELLSAIANSNRSYEEILAFLNGKEIDSELDQ